MKYVQLDDFSINYRSFTPFAEQLSDFIFQQIVSGKYQAGDKLPTIRDAASSLNLGVVTVNNAYKNLIKKNVLESHGRQGIYVSYPSRDAICSAHNEKKIAVNAAEERFLSLIESAITFGIEHGITTERLDELINWSENRVFTEGTEHV